MKVLALLILAGLSTNSAHANYGATIYCEDGNSKKVMNIFDEDAFSVCVGALAGIGGGACFVGKRADAVALLNSRYVRDLFDGTDGEYIKDAHFKGKDSIAYTSVDEANEISSKRSISRCAKD